MIKGMMVRNFFAGDQLSKEEQSHDVPTTNEEMFRQILQEFAKVHDEIAKIREEFAQFRLPAHSADKNPLLFDIDLSKPSGIAAVDPWR